MLTYLKGWFLIDFIAIIPFDMFLGVSGYNGLTRILKLPKLYRLIKMTRLIRMFKILKQRNKLVKYMGEFMKIGVGFERLLFFLLLFLIICHIVACLWIFTSKIQGDPKITDFCGDNSKNWICEGGF